MSIRNFHSLFHPSSVAVIGASQRLHSVGETVLRNLIAGSFHGAIFPVNPKYKQLAGYTVYSGIHELPIAPDLAVICTPPSTIPQLIAQLGQRGTRAAIILSSGLSAVRDKDGRTIREAVLAHAKPYLLRILGPNCVGLLIPAIGLNASFAHTNALPGKLAFLSQSGAMVTGVLDWAKSHGIGFSAFVSLGDSADIDVGDMLDYLALDGGTEAILMYIEEVRQARKFMSAARAAARIKPVIVVKAGRVPEAARAVTSHTGALAGEDLVYDTAFRRAGMLRVFSTAELFGAVETLARARNLPGDRLAIMTNGGGPGVMALDALISGGGRLAELSNDTLERLNRILPSAWPRANSVDIIGDAPPARYAETLKVLLLAPEVDAVLFIHAPTAIVPSAEIAAALAPMIQETTRNVLTCWLGADAVVDARHVFAHAGIPCYDTPEDAVSGFLHMAQYQHNQQLLLQVPPSITDDDVPDREQALNILRTVASTGRQVLTEPESKAILSAYRIPTVATQIAADANDVPRCMHDIGGPVAVKILSPDITHKSDVGGVALDLDTPEAAHAAALAMQERLQRLRPDARLDGFSVQPMIRRPQARELIAGIAADQVFGPVILFGQGGIAVELAADRALALPPLNMLLARDLVSRTRVARLLEGYRGQLPARLDDICHVLVRLSQLAIDCPQVAELDINPLLADHQGVLALDARIRIVPEQADRADRLAIRPYPDKLEQWVEWRGQPLLIRPIRPEDAEAHVRFFEALAPDDVRMRMAMRMRTLSPAQLARFTQIDYDREMAFIATRKGQDGIDETLGVARAIADPDNIEAEFAVIVRSDLKGQGLGHLLMSGLIAYCRNRGTQRLVGMALRYNHAMRELAKSLGFEVTADADPTTVWLRLDLAQATGNMPPLP